MSDLDVNPQASEPANNQKHVKLRESCDSCLAAKVKCGKEKPLCRRCLVNGSHCAYSPSLKTGRKSQNTASKTARDATHAVTSNTNSSPTNGAYEPSQAAFRTAKITDLLSDGKEFFGKESPNFANSQAPLLQTDSSYIPFDGVGPHDRLFDPSFNSTEFLDPFLPFFGSEGPFDPHPMASQQSIGAPKSGFSPLMKTHGSPLSRPWTPSQPIGPVVHTPPSSNSSPQELPDLLCDCFSACVQVLQALHKQSNLLSASPQDGGPSFDVVLKSNADALESCTKVLNCTHCASEYSVMILATIIGKVISVYRAACDLMFNSTAHEENKAQLAFGAYKLTGESRQLLEMEFLFLDLRRVTGVLIGFAQRFCDPPTDSGSSNGISDVLRSHLENDLNDLVKVIQEAKDKREEGKL